MQSLLDGVRAIPGVFAGWTPQVSFFNQPDGSVGFCFQGSPLPSDYRGEYCMASSSSGHEWTPARQVRGAPLPPNGSKFSAPPLLQWNGKQGAAAKAGVLYAYVPLGVFSAGPAAWNGTTFVWEDQVAREMKPVWSGLNGGGLHGMVRLTQGVHAGRLLTQWQHDHHGVLYMHSDDGGSSWSSSTNRAVVPGDFYGGVEPSTVELSNGTLLTFIRTMVGAPWVHAGHTDSTGPEQATLWQARSTDGGQSFDLADGPRPTGLISYFCPVLVLRVPQPGSSGGGGGGGGGGSGGGSSTPIVLVFNNARPQVGIRGNGGEAYRAVLHAAVSLDDGKSWQGFREVMRDDAMKGGAHESGDHGTAYPEGVAARDGSVLFLSGQGAGHWSAMRFQPSWLLQTAQTADWTTPEAAAQWNNVSNFEGSYVSGCTAGTPTDSSTHPLGNARIAACATCTGAVFDPQMHRYVFLQPDANSSTIKLFAHNTLPKCEELSCTSPAGERPVQFNPCTIARAHEDTPPTFERFQLSNWGNRSGYAQWAANSTNWFSCQLLNISSVHARVPCSEHDGVEVRPPQLTAADPLHSGHTARKTTASVAPQLALCAALDARARSAGFSWNFPSSHHGTLRLRVLLEREGFQGAQLSLSDHWEPPWHDRHEPSVSVFVLDIAPYGLRPPGAFGTFFELTLAWSLAAESMTASWSIAGTTTTAVAAVGGAMNVTRMRNMTVGAGGINYVTIKAHGPGGICVATASKEERAATGM